MTSAPDALFRPRIESLAHLHSGKVRDLYAIDAERMLIVASDRLSAFDVVLPTPIPGKGRMLTELSNFWFARMGHVIPNHLLDVDLATVLTDPRERAQVEGRAVVARRLRPLPVEAIVRGYLIGSGWRDYQETGAIGGLPLPAGLRLADRLPEPVFTPSTKAAAGGHDVNIGFDEVARTIGNELAEQVRVVSLQIYREAAEYAAGRGILIADTKFEFGLDAAGGLVLIDELLTPDSSRFWPASEWRPGDNPPSFDKQFIRDWLERQDWDKTAPGPEIPDAIARESAARYREALDRLTGTA
ncbi:MAG: phosphoribosylaminoimidazolesuccinocarboxamide synthase [Halofilum sp. (in: g-proteobacteria)]|nr:phosphoribosylaminoimidazolesuccinocarboxamide synthase [Halofilum sp. (in: g-proteobacteria)]